MDWGCQFQPGRSRLRTVEGFDLIVGFTRQVEVHPGLQFRRISEQFYNHLGLIITGTPEKYNEEGRTLQSYGFLFHKGEPDYDDKNCDTEEGRDKKDIV